MKKTGTPIVVLIVALAVIAGCRVEMEVTVTLTDLLEEHESKFIMADLYAEVASCRDFEDSRKPSSSLLEARETVPRVFADAEFVDCFSVQFDSLARFTVPVMLDKENDQQWGSDAHVNIRSYKETLEMWVDVPPAIRTALKDVERESLQSIDLGIEITVVNDSGADYELAIIAAYVDGEAYTIQRFTSLKGRSFEVVLSDVSVSRALEVGGVMVLYGRPSTS